jgi:alpha-beta hydrolase superfamily lysophospholipase
MTAPTTVVATVIRTLRWLATTEHDPAAAAYADDLTAGQDELTDTCPLCRDRHCREACPLADVRHDLWVADQAARARAAFRTVHGSREEGR